MAPDGSHNLMEVPQKKRDVNSPDNGKELMAIPPGGRHNLTRTSRRCTNSPQGCTGLIRMPLGAATTSCKSLPGDFMGMSFGPGAIHW
jgi:hypothetical protein